ncbi:hypothetical protein BOX15_Mlig003947g1 [Macrostomum lignano]|uniref:GST C-terminal domain-containing protein n=2 Tax=Macrostomum lignano TaxID=282301 RepID=A0A1I8G6K1_9PLAT|nr:hypothetical protein BOX15_Mlig003947g1 [Macrostomum lignano]
MASTSEVEQTPVANGTESIPSIELFIKASQIAREEKGPCPISQQWILAFYILAEKKLTELYLTTVNPDVPPDSYLALNVSRRLPVANVTKGPDPRLKTSNAADAPDPADTNDEIEQLMDAFRCPNLALPKDSRDEANAEKAICDLYKNFSLMLKTDNRAPLINSLRKIDNFLGLRPCRYLLSDELTYADCQLMPKLHHVRLAGEFYRGFTIPEELRHLQDYLVGMYTACDAFRTSCPADRDILHLYYDKVPRSLLSSISAQPTLMDNRRTLLGESGGTGGIPY